jgi:hypothetical protein
MSPAREAKHHKPAPMLRSVRVRRIEGTTSVRRGGDRGACRCGYEKPRPVGSATNRGTDSSITFAVCLGIQRARGVQRMGTTRWTRWTHWTGPIGRVPTTPPHHQESHHGR